MGAHHHHHHHENDAKLLNKKILTIAFVVTAIYAISEVFFGFFFNSLALLSEGFHMLSDSISLGLSLVAAILAFKKPTNSLPFGYRRIETVTAFINGVALLLIPIIVVYEAFERLHSSKQVSGLGIISIAVIGLIVNIVVAFTLSKGNREQNLNLKSAFLHVFADILSSIGAIAAGIIILLTNWVAIDAIISIIVSIFIFVGGVRVTKESLHILLEGSSSNIKLDELKTKLMALQGVNEINHLKTWTITSGEDYAIVHIKINHKDYAQEVLESAKQIFHDFHFKSTIEISAVD